MHLIIVIIRIIIWCTWYKHHHLMRLTYTYNFIIIETVLESIISSTWFRLLVYLTLVITVIKPPWLSPWISSSLPSSQKSFFSGDPWAGGHLTQIGFTNPSWPFPPFLSRLASLPRDLCDSQIHSDLFHHSCDRKLILRLCRRMFVIYTIRIFIFHRRQLFFLR